MKTVNVLEILLLERTLVLSPAQLGTGSKRVKISVENQKTIRLFSKSLEKCD